MRVIRIVLIILVCMLVGIGIMSQPPVSFAQATNQNICNEVNLSSCDATQFDITSCYNSYREAPNFPLSYGSNNTNWTAGSCAVIEGCFVPLPGFFQDQNAGGQQLGACIPPATASYLTCDNRPTDSNCPSNEYEICFQSRVEASQLPPGSLDYALECDCEVQDNSIPTPLCLFRDQASYEAALNTQNVGCVEIGTPGDGNNCGGNQTTIECIANDRKFCCPTQASCEDISGEKELCQRIGPTDAVTGTLRDCNEINPDNPITCSAGIQGLDFYCCQTVDACEDIRILGVPGTGGTPLDPGDDDIEQVEYKLCEQVPGSGKQQCETCQGNKGIWTAVGCIPYAPADAVGSLVTVGLGIAGGVAMLMILAAGWMISSSAGDPKKVGEAQEMIQSAVIGLLFVVFSIVILQFIGVSILHIPGFGE